MRFQLTVLTLCSAIAAQGVVPPFSLSLTNPLPGLSVGSVPGINVQQICMVHMPSDPSNVFLCGLSCDGLSSTYGGVGSTDVVEGSYDVLTDTFTPNANAAALNTTGLEFGFQIHHSGVFAMIDRLPGPPHFCSRTAVGQPWVDVGAVSPIPVQSYYDPSLADFQGQTYLLHVLGTDIAMTPINTSSGALIGPSVVIVHGFTAASTANSPTPIVDVNGELIGVSHHDLVGAINEHRMSLDLDAGTPSTLLNHNNNSWTNNGGFIGGRFIDAEYTPSPYHAFAIDAIWWTGGRAAVGTNMNIAFYSPPTSGPELYLSLMLISSSFLTTGQAIPLVQGQLGLPTNPLIMTGFQAHDNTNGSSAMVLPVPNTPSLSGLRLPAQSVTYEVVGNVFTFGNTATLRVD